MNMERNHKLMGIWMLLLGAVNSEGGKILWFVVNGVPIHYSIREQALLSRLDCHEYPNQYENMGSNLFQKRQFKNKKTITVQDVKKKLLTTKACGDRLKMAVLYVMCTVIGGRTKYDWPIDGFLLRMVNDLEACKSFPWGQWTFGKVVEAIHYMLRKMKDFVSDTTSISGFIIPLEGKFKASGMTGFPLEEIYDALGTSKNIQCVLEQDEYEEVLLARIVDEELENVGGGEITDRWNERLTKERKAI